MAGSSSGSRPVSRCTGGSSSRGSAAAAVRRAEPLDPVTTTLVVPSRCSSLPRGQHETRGPHRQAAALDDRRRHDQVDRPPLVLEQHEDDPVGGRRPLAGDHHPRHLHPRAVPRPSQALAAKHIVGQFAPDQLHRVSAERHPGRPVVGHDPLPRARAAAAAGRADPSSGSASCAPSSVRAARAEPPDLPEGRPPQSVAGSTGRARAPPGSRRRPPRRAAASAARARARASREVRDAAIRAAAPALVDHGLRVDLRHLGDVSETDPHRRVACRARRRSGRLDPAVELADVDVRRPGSRCPRRCASWTSASGG